MGDRLAQTFAQKSGYQQIVTPDSITSVNNRPANDMDKWFIPTFMNMMAMNNPELKAKLLQGKQNQYDQEAAQWLNRVQPQEPYQQGILGDK